MSGDILQAVTNVVTIIGVGIAVWQLFHVAAKIEEVHIATNSMKDALVARTAEASDAAGEKRGIDIGVAQANLAAENARNPPSGA